MSVEPEYERFCVKIMYGKYYCRLPITRTTKTLIETENGFRFRKPVRAENGVYLTKTTNREIGYFYILENI